ncbi:MAG: carboxypeptidase-like regulatory domain-containing protein, partial [Marinilabiliaceae bacterium]
MKKYFLSIILLFIVALSLHAQEVIKGRVIDASNGKPVEFANIGVIDSFTGNASDEKGFFELKIPEDMLGEKIRVSAVGYQAREFEISSLLEEDELTIEMVPVVYNINEISVNAPSRVLYGMLKMAVRQKHRNYVTGSYSSDVEYREKEGDRAKILQLDYTDASGYSERTSEDAFLNRNYTITEGERNYEQSPFAGGLVRVEELLEFDILRNPGNVLDTTFLDHFRVFEKEKKVEEGKHIIVIGFECLSSHYAYTGDSRIMEMNG